mgnify:CR=1 FL=1
MGATERATFVIVATFLLFIATNMDQTLGLIFVGFALINQVAFSADKRHTFMIQKNKSLIASIPLAIMGWGASILLSWTLVNILGSTGFIQTAAIGFDQLLSIISEAQSTLAFSNSYVLNLVSFGVLVPIVETVLFGGTLFELGTDLTKTSIPGSLSGISLTLFLIMIAIAGVFTAFHFTSKGVGNDVALVSVFSFMVVTLIVILVEKQLAAAVQMHIIANTIAISLNPTFALGLSLTTLFLIVLGVLVLLLANENIRSSAIAAVSSA